MDTSGKQSVDEQRTASVNQRLMSEHPALAGKYTILEKLGRGAQASVFKAKSVDGQIVAIKVFDFRDIEDVKSVELLEREVEVLRNLKIDGIPKYIDCIEAIPNIYLVESFIEAKSLEQWLKEGIHPTTEQVCEILSQALTILDKLHQQLPPVIHRDIKPGNVLVDMAGDTVKVWIVDLGSVTSLRRKSRASTVAGTIGYAAPEQFLGKATPASDIYGLGMTLVHLVSGVEPWNMDVDGLEIQYEKYLPENLPDYLKMLLSEMLKSDPKTRISDAKSVKKRLKKLKKQSKTYDVNASSYTSSNEHQIDDEFDTNTFWMLDQFSLDEQKFIVREIKTVTKKSKYEIAEGIRKVQRTYNDISGKFELISKTMDVLLNTKLDEKSSKKDSVPQKKTDDQLFSLNTFWMLDKYTLDDKIFIVNELRDRTKKSNAEIAEAIQKVQQKKKDFGLKYYLIEQVEEELKPGSKQTNIPVTTPKSTYDSWTPKSTYETTTSTSLEETKNYNRGLKHNFIFWDDTKTAICIGGGFFALPILAVLGYLSYVNLGLAWTVIIGVFVFGILLHIFIKYGLEKDSHLGLILISGYLIAGDVGLFFWHWQVGLVVLILAVIFFAFVLHDS